MTAWPSGWSEIVDANQAKAIGLELAREVGKGHQLYGLKCEPFATNYLDDYLFRLADGRVAEVHLTFANAPERPPWPGTSIHQSFEDWRKSFVDE